MWMRYDWIYWCTDQPFFVERPKKNCCFCVFTELKNVQSERERFNANKITPPNARTIVTSRRSHTDCFGVVNTWRRKAVWVLNDTQYTTNKSGREPKKASKQSGEKKKKTRTHTAHNTRSREKSKNDNWKEEYNTRKKQASKQQQQHQQQQQQYIYSVAHKLAVHNTQYNTFTDAHQRASVVIVKWSIKHTYTNRATNTLSPRAHARTQSLQPSRCRAFLFGELYIIEAL